MGEFNNRHLDLITYSSIYDANTILDLYSDNINKDLRITYVPFCYLKSLKIKQKQNDIYCLWKQILILTNTHLKVSLLVQICHIYYCIKRCEKHFKVINVLNIK